MLWNDMVGFGLEHVGRAAVGMSGMRHRPVGATELLAHPGEGPVALIGGFGETRPCLAPMETWLTRVGYDVTVYTLGAGMGCSQRTTESLVRRVRVLAEETGRPVRLVGHSRGGQLARAVGIGAPESVSHLVTIGTPFGMTGTSPGMAAFLLGFAAAGTVGVPGLYRLGCLLSGACCTAYRAAVREPWPTNVPFTSIYSRSDGAVSWRACQVPGARHVEVPSGHIAQLTAAPVQRAVAEALALPGPGPSVTAA